MAGQTHPPPQKKIFCFLLCLSLEVFKALGFDPHTMRCVQPEGGPPPPQDALACLHKLSSMVSQLLQAFSRYVMTVKTYHWTFSRHLLPL